jgi:hypothetical protein
MPASFLDAVLDGPFKLTPRPEPVAGDLRMAWGIALVVLMLGRSRGKRASLQKLHFLAYAARTRIAREEAERVLTGAIRPKDFIFRVEPWLNRAVAFARGAGLIEVEAGKRFKLTKPGIEILEAVSEAKFVLEEEKAFLDAVGSRATEGALEKILRVEPML